MKDCTNLDENSQSHGMSFARLVEYIDESRQEDNHVVFKLADLCKIYSDQLELLGTKVDGRLHSTRLKNRLQAHFLDLETYNVSKDVFLSFKDDVGTTLSKAYKESYDDEAINVVTAAKIIRRDVLATASKNSFSGSFSEASQSSSVPISLVELISMIL